LIDYVEQEGHTDRELDQAMRDYRAQYGAQ